MRRIMNQIRLNRYLKSSQCQTMAWNYFWPFEIIAHPKYAKLDIANRGSHTKCYCKPLSTIYKIWASSFSVENGIKPYLSMNARLIAIHFVRLPHTDIYTQKYYYMSCDLISSAPGSLSLYDDKQRNSLTSIQNRHWCFLAKRVTFIPRQTPGVI